MMDPISDMLTRIRNAHARRKTEVVLPYSKLKFQLAKILVEEGYIAGVSEQADGAKKQLKLELKYIGSDPAIRTIRRISKPGRRIYLGSKRLPFVFDDLGIAIVSTSRGLMTNKQARKQKIGGEVICEVF
jgi:small subunit ribosomal protein S8